MSTYGTEPCIPVNEETVRRAEQWHGTQRHHYEFIACPAAVCQFAHALGHPDIADFADTLVRSEDVLTLDDAGVERLAKAEHAECEARWQRLGLQLTQHGVDAHREPARAVVERLRGEQPGG